MRALSLLKAAVRPMLSRSSRQEAIAAATPGSAATTASEPFFVRESQLVDGGVKFGGV